MSRFGISSFPSDNQMKILSIEVSQPPVEPSSYVLSPTIFDELRQILCGTFIRHPLKKSIHKTAQYSIQLFVYVDLRTEPSWEFVKPGKGLSFSGFG